MPEVDGVVAERGPADRAVFRVGDVLEGAGVECGILHPEVDRPLGAPPKARDERVVRIQDDGAVRG